MQTKDIPLHDIKPLIEIQEYSLYYFIALVGVVSIVTLLLVYLLINYLKNRNSFNIRAEHLKLLKEINLNDTKNAAYEITLHGSTFEFDSEHHSRTYLTLVEDLETYKYKKNVESFNRETKNSIENYIGMLDV